MHVIKVRNVHQALPEAIRQIAMFGEERESRNGPVRVIPGPVTTMYTHPTERVLFWPERDANPFFHFFESLWMLNGCNDVAYLEQFVRRMREFSDDGVTFHGAYGFRWREFFGFDQLDVIIKTLKANPDDRRCVLQMWDPNADLGGKGKDLPCNTQAYFAVATDDRLDMTVCNRSNDIIWGAYGANAVHFSFLQEYVASAVGVPVGRYWQVSNNWHAYLKTLEPLQHLAERTTDGISTPSGFLVDCPYSLHHVATTPIMSLDRAVWDRDLTMFLAGRPVIGYRDPFFRRVANPLWAAWCAFKENKAPGRYEAALEVLEQCRAPDWKLACADWVNRRWDRWRDNGESS